MEEYDGQLVIGAFFGNVNSRLRPTFSLYGVRSTSKRLSGIIGSKLPAGPTSLGSSIGVRARIGEHFYASRIFVNKGRVHAAVEILQDPKYVERGRELRMTKGEPLAWRPEM